MAFILFYGHRLLQFCQTLRTVSLPKNPLISVLNNPTKPLCEPILRSLSVLFGTTCTNVGLILTLNSMPITFGLYLKESSECQNVEGFQSNIFAVLYRSSRLYIPAWLTTSAISVSPCQISALQFKTAVNIKNLIFYLQILCNEKIKFLAPGRRSFISQDGTDQPVRLLCLRF